MALSAITVALVGRRLPHNENLGLGYLRAALEAAGVGVTTHFVNDPGELARAVGAILAAPPEVVGLSLADGGSALWPLALGEALARAGYRGHVTSGGQFATLARAWLLERYPWLDSVVRFAGEVPLVALCERLRSGLPVEGVPGVTTRAGDGPPAPVLDGTPLTLRPKRDVLPEILGHPAVHIAASRGCRGRCQYCGPAALHTLERREGVRAGVAAAVLSEHGVGGVRRRELEAVCDEMAELWHGRGVRYFYFVDEHLLPYAEDAALAYLADFRRGLEARGVGALGIGAMLRADRLTPAVARAFAAAGLVRCFVGLEVATPADARHFARAVPSARDLELLRTFAEAGVTTVSNLMLLHPYATPESIAAGIELLERIPAGVFEATRMMPYHGTRLQERLAAEGRLVGNPLRYGYRFDDPRMEGFAEIFSRLRGEAFWNYSVAYRTHDAYLAVSLARRLHPARVRPPVVARLDAVRARVNALYVEGYRRALALALAGGGYAEAAPLVAALQAPVAAVERELERIEADLLAEAPGAARPFAPLRGAAAGVVSFVLGTAACGGKAVIDGSGGAGAASGTGGSGGSATCPVPPPVATTPAVQAALADDAACFSGSVTWPPGTPPSVGFSFWAYGTIGGVAVTPCPTPPSTAAAQAEEADARAALACFAPPPSQLDVWVDGGAYSDGQKMADAIWNACSGLINFTPVTIVLDAQGYVVEVVPTPGAEALAACIQQALAGLAFPCLASFEVCPEYAIAE
ncbi:MAG: radical SAM protein [Polyangiaceae bacterium]|nr:radical SAM protein [Polyangiaceae bacterium]